MRFVLERAFNPATAEDLIIAIKNRRLSRRHALNGFIENHFTSRIPTGSNPTRSCRSAITDLHCGGKSDLIREINPIDSARDQTSTAKLFFLTNHYLLGLFVDVNNVERFPRRDSQPASLADGYTVNTAVPAEDFA